MRHVMWVLLRHPIVSARVAWLLWRQLKPLPREARMARLQQITDLADGLTTVGELEAVLGDSGGSS